eukprot:104592_1
MGNCFNQSDGDKQNNMVDRQLDRDRRKFGKVKKILFLGSGGSGKSTIFKQLRGIYGTGFNANERKQFVGHIHEQVITQMKLALEVLEEYRTGNLDDILRQNERQYVDEKDEEDMDEDELPELELSESAQDASHYLNHIHFTSYKLNDDIVTHLKCLWAEPAIQKMYELRNITKIEDSSAYFWNKLDSLNNFGYVPDEADILLVRNRTTGAKEEKYEMPDGKGSFSIVDVGGQKSERKKWIKCFDSVTAVIFVASLSCYDEVLFEDYAINSMTDQLELFDNVCNNQSLAETSMILFLNKQDLFSQKIKSVSITKCASFADYHGDPHGFDATTQYIRKAFTSLNNMPNRKNIFTHITCATDHNNIQKVFADVQHIVIEASLIQAGLMDWDDNQRFQSMDAAEEEAAEAVDPETAAIIRQSIMNSGKMRTIPDGSRPLRSMIAHKSNTVQYWSLIQQYKYDFVNRACYSDDVLSCTYCWGCQEEETYVALDIDIAHSIANRKCINLCIVLDVCDAMDSEFGDAQKKMDVVKECISQIARHRLKQEDRLCLIVFGNETRLMQEIESVAKINLDRLCRMIDAMDVESGGGDCSVQAYQCALSQFKKLRTQRKVSMAYTNRIMMISPSIINAQILTDAASAVQKRIYSTFVGICNRFSLQRNTLNNMNGCNHACIFSSEQLKHKVVTRFDEMMTPLMFDLKIDITNKNTASSCIQSVHRLNGPAAADKDRLHIATVFAKDHKEDHQLFLCKVSTFTDLQLVITFTDQSHQNVNNVIPIPLTDDTTSHPLTNYYDNNAIRKAILLARYVNLLHQWRQQNNQSKNGIISNAFQKKIQYFIQHFETESRLIKDTSLTQEINVLQSMLK